MTFCTYDMVIWCGCLSANVGLSFKCVIIVQENKPMCYHGYFEWQGMVYWQLIFIWELLSFWFASANTRKIHVWCDLNRYHTPPIIVKSERWTPTLLGFCSKWVKYQVLVSHMLWFFPLKSISHALFWYPIALGLQPPRPTTSEVGGPLGLRCSAAADPMTEWTLGYHSSRQ